MIRNRKIAEKLAFVVMMIPIVVLLGWMLHNEYMKRVIPSLVQMNPLTAILMIMSALAFLFLQRKMFTLSFSLSLAAALISGIRLAGFADLFDIHIDQLLFSVSLEGNRMAPNTTLNLCMDSTAILLLSVNREKIYNSLAQSLSLLSFAIALLAVIGYLYAFLSLYQLSTYIPMALHAALCFLLLSSAILLQSSDQGFMSVIFEVHSGGQLARRFLPAAILTPIALGWLRILGQHARLFDPEFGTALLIICIIGVFALVIWFQASSLNKSDLERKRAEEELIRARQVAENAKLVQEQFLANMSHEIRTPMNGVIGMTNLLSGTLLDTDQREYVDTIRESAGNLLVIINDILDFNKITAGKLSFEDIDFSIRDVVSNVVKIINYKAEEKGLRLESFVEDSIQQVYLGDPVRLNQILLNLVGNAIKFTGKGTVRVSVSLAADTADSSLLCFRVSDTGIGIPADKLDSVFESFTQASASTTRKYGGSGLGLTITRQLVEMQDGKIYMSSELGKGSTFTVELTYMKGKMDVRTIVGDSLEAPDENLTFKGVNVLLVEDNKINQKVALYTIQKWGAEVDIAENGTEALRMLDKKSYQVILMDLQMPDMDGFETTEYIRTRMPAPFSGIPIIAMTASALISERSRCLSVGMNDYISKPFNAKELQDKIAAALASS